MIDERLEAIEYSKGNNYNKDNLYRTIYLMAKLYLSDGIDIPDVRQKIFEWGRQYGVWIKYSVNDIVIKAHSDKRPLNSGVSIYVNNDDIYLIKSLFDDAKIQYCALSLLCYAKAYADNGGIFALSSVPFCNWIGVGRTYFGRKAIKEIELLRYLDVIKPNNKKPNWIKGEHLSTTRYRMRHPFTNSGEFLLEGNDVLSLFSMIFGKELIISGR